MAEIFDQLRPTGPNKKRERLSQADAERLECLFVSADFFPMLGVNAALGRTFLPQEDNRTQPSNVAILSHSLWQRRFGGSRDVIGKEITLDSTNATVIGVLPQGFRYLGEPVAGTTSEIDAWIPMSANQLVGSVRSVRYMKVIGRLKPGVSVAQAEDDVHRIGMALARM